MKICFLSSLYAEKELGGGVRTYLKQMSTAMAKKGHEVTIVSGGKQCVSENEVRVIGLGSIPLYKGGWGLLSPIFIWYRFRYMWRALLYIRKNKFDVVEVADGGFEQLFLVLKLHCLIVTRMHGSTVDTKETVFKSIVKSIENFCIRRSSGVSSPTKSYADYVLGNESVRVVIIPYGIPLKSRKTIKIRGKNKKNIKKILFVGALCKRKGIDYLIQVANELLKRDDILFQIVGGNLEDVDIRKFPKNMEYIGYVSRDRLAEYYMSCDLLFVPSYMETFGICVIEAMSYGKPVVAANVVGLKDVVQHNENGYLFEHGNVNKTVELLVKLTDNSELKKKFGKESLELVQQYELNSMVDKTIDFYKSLLIDWEV